MTLTADRAAPSASGRRRPAPPAAPDRSRARLTIAAIVFIAAVTTSLTGVFEGVGWWVFAVATAAAVLATSAVLRGVGVPAWLAPVGGAVVLVMIITLFFGGGTGWGGVIPSPATFARLHDLLTVSSQQIVEETIPVPPSAPLMLVVLLGAGVTALATDLLAVVAGTPALCGLPALMILSLPVILLDSGLSVWRILLALAGYLLLLVVADGGPGRLTGRRGRIGMLTAAGSTVLALVVGMTAPGFGSVGVMPDATAGSSVGGGVNPLIDLGRDLRKPIAVPVLHYTTTATDGLYLRLTSLDRFTGDTWTRSRQSAHDLPAGGALSDPPGLSHGVRRSSATTTVEVGRLDSRWAPLPYPSSRVTGLSGDWTVGADQTVTGRGTGAQEQRYTATSLVLDPTRAELSRASTRPVPADVRRDLELPSDVPSIIVKTAAKAVAGARNHYQEAVDLESYFRGGTFTYSLRTPLKEGYDGDGLKVIARFLKVKSGYCVHFASAMAIMARVLGIPARVAIGYLPGSIGPSEGSAGYRYTVTSDELHSWTELYFPGVGWLPFDPTVGQGVVPTYAQPATVETDPTAAASAPAVPEPTASRALPDQGADIGAARGRTASAQGDLRILLTVVAILILLALPALAGFARSRWGRRRVLRGARPALRAWHELDRLARDLRLAPARAPTVRERARVLAGAAPGGGPPVDAAPEDGAVLRLRDAVERELYGRPHPLGEDERRMLLADLDAASAGLRARAGRGRRVWARMLPASLAPAPPSVAARGGATA